MSAGTLDSLPQNGAVVTLRAVCGSTHRESYFDIVMAAIVGPIIAIGRSNHTRFGVRLVLTHASTVRRSSQRSRKGRS